MFIVKYQPKLFSFDKWLKENPDVLDDESDCEACDGAGSHECWNCGHVSECETCGGTGKSDARFLYNQQKEKDEKLWMKGLATNNDNSINNRLSENLSRYPVEFQLKGK